ncbi:uncharacterized protein G2W53_033006 [Senna tora]|uniref:Uncharacterized protein n=1 Tax=Senna tora TaxID=362788 RepID=A0A834W6R0_9FABA|nr:uncharacterized protein G2W53_033006 [Senna tora]
MTNDASILEKLLAFRSAQVDLSCVEDQMSTPINSKSAPINVLDGRKLSFVDAIDSPPSVSTPSTRKRSPSNAFDDRLSTIQHSIDLDVPLKRIKLEKKSIDRTLSQLYTHTLYHRHSSSSLTDTPLSSPPMRRHELGG